MIRQKLQDFFSGIILFLKLHFHMLMPTHFVQVLLNCVSGKHYSNSNICSGLGLGLAFWKGEERYQDVDYISTTYGAGLYTALNNELQYDCASGACNGKLV